MRLLPDDDDEESSCVVVGSSECDGTSSGGGGGGESACQVASRDGSTSPAAAADIGWLSVPAIGSCSLFVDVDEEEEVAAAAAAALAANSFNPLLVFLNPRASRPSPPPAVVVVDGPERDPDADRERERDDESEPEPAAAQEKPNIVLDPLCGRVVVPCFRLVLLLLPLVVVVVVAELDRRLLLSVATPPPASRVVRLLVHEEPSSRGGGGGGGRVSPCSVGTGRGFVPIGTRRSDDDADGASGGGGPFRWFFGFEDRNRCFFALDDAEEEVAVPRPSCEAVPFAAEARGSTNAVNEAAVATEAEEDAKDGRRLS